MLLEVVTRLKITFVIIILGLEFYLYIKRLMYYFKNTISIKSSLVQFNLFQVGIKASNLWGSTSASISFAFFFIIFLTMVPFFKVV